MEHFNLIQWLLSFGWFGGSLDYILNCGSSFFHTLPHWLQSTIKVFSLTSTGGGCIACELWFLNSYKNKQIIEETNG